MAGMPVLAIDPATVKPGLLAFFVVAGLGVATFFLVRSMNKQLRKIDFDEGGDEGGDEGSRAEQTGGTPRSDGPKAHNGEGGPSRPERWRPAE